MRILIVAAIPMFLIACGGGGGGGPVVLPTNSPPVFTSPASANVIENTALALQATATDADGQALNFSIAGGLDAAFFTIGQNGQLSFVTPPSFETPRDGDGDNIYAVTIGVSDGRVTTSQNVQVTVINSREGVAVRRLSTRFVSPVAASPVSGGSGLLLVAEKSGSVWSFDPASGAKTLIDTIQNVGQATDQGMLAVVPDPGYATNGRFFVAFVNTAGSLQVREYIPNALLPPLQDRTRPVLFVPQPSGGEVRSIALAFGIDAALYVAVGDAGGTNDPSNSAQNSASLQGKLLRIIRNPDPFAGATAQFYIVSTVGSGLRNPGGLLSFGSEIYVSDIGQSRFGEINRWPAGGTDRNFGWPFREGTADNVGSPPAGLTAPVLQVAFGTGRQQGRSIVSGVVYTGAIASLANQMVFGDASGAVWTVPFASLVDGSTVSGNGYERRNEDFTPDAGVIDGIAVIVAGAVGRILIFDRDGDVFAVEPAP